MHRQGVCKEQAARTCLLGNGTAVCNRTAATVLASGTHTRDVRQPGKRALAP